MLPTIVALLLLLLTLLCKHHVILLLLGSELGLGLGLRLCVRLSLSSGRLLLGHLLLLGCLLRLDGSRGLRCTGCDARGECEGRRRRRDGGRDRGSLDRCRGEVWVVERFLGVVSAVGLKLEEVLEQVDRWGVSWAMLKFKAYRLVEPWARSSAGAAWGACSKAA